MPLIVGELSQPVSLLTPVSLTVTEMSRKYHENVTKMLRKCHGKVTESLSRETG